MEHKKIADLQENIFGILVEVAKEYSDQPEYQTIKMNLSTTLKEINAMRIRSIVGDINSQYHEE